MKDRSGAVLNSYRTTCKSLTPRYLEHQQQNKIEKLLKATVKAR